MAKQPLMRMRPWLCVLYASTHTTLNMSTPKYNPFFSPTSIEDQTQQENQNLDIEWSFFHQTGVLTSFYILSVWERVREDRDSSSYINTLPSIQPSNSFYFWNYSFLANAYISTMAKPKLALPIGNRNFGRNVLFYPHRDTLKNNCFQDVAVGDALPSFDKYF